MSRSDAAYATVWAAAVIGMLLVVLAVGVELTAAVALRHRAEGTADRAALAAAIDAVRGEGPACARAATLVRDDGGTLRRCLLDGWEVLVEVELVRRPLLPGLPGAAIGRARAGPVDAADAVAHGL